MGWMDEYNKALKKKRITTSSDSAFMDDYYRELERLEQLQDDEVAPLSTVGSLSKTPEVTVKGNASNDNSFMSDYYANLFEQGYDGMMRTYQKPAEVQEKRKWFQKGAFEDGFDWSDIPKTILGSSTDVRRDVGAGVIGMGEMILDAAMWLAPAATIAQQAQNPGYIFDINEYNAQKETAAEFIKKDLYDEDKVAKAIISPWTEAVGVDVEKDSVLGEKADDLAKSGGQLAATAALQAAGVPWFVTTGLTSFGGEVENAFNQDASYEEAGLSAAITAGAEILTEKMSGGIKFGGATLDDALTREIARGISNKTVRTLTKLGLDMVGEGSEEVLSGVWSAIGQKITYADNKELNELFSSEDAWDSFIGGAILGGGSSTTNAIQSKANGVDSVTGFNAVEQQAVDTIYQNRVAKAEEKGKVTEKDKRKIYESITRDMEKGFLRAEEIEEVLGGESYEAFKAERDKFFGSDTYKSWSENKKRTDELKTKIEELGKKTDATLMEQVQFQEMRNEFAERRANQTQQKSVLDKEATRVMELRNKMRSETMDRVKDSRLAESYRELQRKTQKFEVDVNQYTNENAKKTVQSILDSGLGDNSNQFHETVDWLAKLSEERNVTFDLTKTERLKGTKHYREGYVTNGFKTTEGDLTNITINLDGNYLNTTVGHEITHVLEQAGIYTELSKAVRDFAISKEGLDKYNARVAAVKEIYGEDQATIDSEITADIIGEYLFTDYDFVHRLSTENRNVFQKVYDEIKYMWKVATAGSKEARELEKVKKMFDKAWRENVNGKTDTKVEANTESNGTIDPENDADLDYESPTKYSLSVTDPETIDFLENQEHITTYKAMVLIDGKLYPPMASKVKGEDGKYHMTNPRELGEWMQAEEDTTNIKFNDKGIGYYDLKKDDGGTVRAAYNPYEHSSNLVLNDQFEAAYKRENLVTVECVIPKSEMTSGYRAEHAKDSTGMMDWHSGVVAGKLTDNKRSVYLSRYLKAVRVLSDAEVAQKYKEIVGDLAVPFNVVSPGLLTELENVGVNIDYDGSPQYQYLQRRAAEKEAKTNAKYSLSKADSGYMDAVNRGDTDSVQKMVDDAAKESGYDIKAYHGTGYDFTVFDKSKQGDNYQDWGRLGKGFYFAPTEREARTWAELSRGGKNKVMPVYLRIENMRDSYEALPDNLKDTIPEDWDSLTKRLAEKYAYHYIDYMQEFGHDVQKILVDKGYDGINGHVEFVVFDPEQVKSADPVTYDDSGNVIPLSERFNSGKTDIRYSIAPEGERNTSGNWHIDGRQFGQQDPLDDFAPIREDIATATTETVPTMEGVAHSGEEEDGTVETVKTKIQQKIANTQAELDKNRQLMEDHLTYYDEEIAKKQAEYDSKKNKNSLAAQGILRSIERLKRLKANSEADYSKRISDLEQRVEKMHSKDYQRAEVRRAKQTDRMEFWGDLIGDTSSWKDFKLGVTYKTKTLRRILRSVVRDPIGNPDIRTADAIYDELETKYDHNEAKLKVESGRLKEAFQKLNLNHVEDQYAQMLGELRHNPETKLSEDVVNDFLEKHKSKINEDKVNTAIEESRKLYDDLIVRVNEVLRANGIKEIPYRKGYFPHFTNPKQNWLQKLLNWKPIDTEIPTSIAGLTQDFKPVKSWQSFAQRRQGDTTDYSLYQGLDTYIHGALDWIYHVDDIQNRRALENYIREIHSDEGVQQRIQAIRADDSLDADEVYDAINAVLDEAKNPLSGLVRELMNRTNTLANKKSSMDREMEDMFNRKVYSTLTNLNNRINANMVVGSFSSALTNFIPMVQSWHQVSPVYTVQGLRDMIRSTIKDDGTIAKSDFLTNRLIEEEKLYKTGWDKASEKGAILMNAIDNITSQTVWRSKYLQNLGEGMSESAAIRDADQFAKNLIAGRSRGNMPSIFDAKNPVTKLFTAFQLEVANQYGYMFEDVPQDSTSKARLVKGYATAFLGAYAYNALYSSLVGRDAAFDPIAIIQALIGDLLDDDEEPEDVLMNFGKNILEEVPFVGGLIGGGRVPMSSALPYSGFSNPIESMLTDFSDEDYKSITKEMLKPLYYLVLPFGGGQIKKTNEGLGMFSDDHPVAGSYTASGNLRFPVEDTFGNRVQAAMFGQYANENARDYFDNNRSALKPNQIEEYMDLDIPIRDYWDIQDGLKGLDKIGDQVDYIDSLDLPIDKKNLLINNRADRKTPIDMTGYDEFDDFEEFDWATKNPEKYDFFTEIGISYKDYQNADEETREDYNWAYQYPQYYTLSKAVTNDILEYRKYYKGMTSLKADKDANGKSISGSKKSKVMDYIFSLDIDDGAKLVLLKSQYESIDEYNEQIFEYIRDKNDLTFEEKLSILKTLGFGVSDDGTVTWD